MSFDALLHALLEVLSTRGGLMTAGISMGLVLHFLLFPVMAPRTRLLRKLLRLGDAQSRALLTVIWRSQCSCGTLWRALRVTQEPRSLLNEIQGRGHSRRCKRSASSLHFSEGV